MKIPKRFYLYGLPIDVKFDDTMEAMGQSCYRENVIKLSRKHCQRKELVEQSFFHELLHFVVYHSKVARTYKLDNGKELHLDEDFIESVSSLLHQALVTAKGTIKV